MTDHDSFHAAEDVAGEAKLLASNYDGIREFDNPMPFWWTGLLWATVFFSAVYFVYYHLGAGATLDESYQAEVGAFVEEQAKALGDLEPDQRTILTLMDDPKLRLGGQVMFRSNCATCHGPEGGGRTGPNLTDDTYINVRSPEDIFRVIKDGVVNKGMPSWERRYSQAQLVLLASYVASLRGTRPVESKEAQGDRIAPWPTMERAEPAPTS